MTNSLTELTKSQSAIARVAENTALVCMMARISVGKQLHTLRSYPVLGAPQGFSSGMLTNKQTTQSSNTQTTTLICNTVDPVNQKLTNFRLKHTNHSNHTQHSHLYKSETHGFHSANYTS